MLDKLDLDRMRDGLAVWPAVFVLHQLAVPLRIPLSQKLQPRFNPNPARSWLVCPIVRNVHAVISDGIKTNIARAGDALVKHLIKLSPVIDDCSIDPEIAADLSKRLSARQSRDNLFVYLGSANGGAHVTRFGG